MFGLGGTEVLVIFVLALLLFGPRKLPEIGRTFGKTLAEFRRATLDFRVSLEREVELDKLKSDTLSPLRDIMSVGETPPPAAPTIPQRGLPAVPAVPAVPAAPVAPAAAELEATASQAPPREDVVRRDEA